MGKLEHFSITYDHSHAVYKAGDVVRGQVHVHLLQPMKMRHLKLWCQGKGKVHWTTTRRAGKHTHMVHYHGEEVYFDTTVILAGQEHGEITLEAGQHTFDFTIPLADNLPSSFEGCYGCVRYMSKATIDKPWKFDHDTKTAFTVISHLDLNTEPIELKTAMMGNDTSDVSCCCLYSGHVSASFRINRRGFVPGECVIINAEVTNNSNSKVLASRVSIKQYTEYFGETDDMFSKGRLTKTESSFVASKQRGQILPGESDRWENVPLQIPAAPPSRLVGCSIINIAYVIKFYASVSYGEEIKMACNIIIGTVPLHESVAERIATGQSAPSAPVVSKQPGQSEPSVPAITQQSSDIKQDAVSMSEIPISILPPSYEQQFGGKVHIREEHDSEYTRGDMQWAPKYPFYRELSVEECDRQ